MKKKKRNKNLWLGLCGFLGIVAVFLIYVALKSSDFHVERQATINAPATVVFAQINDFHNWNAWSPWAKMDPNAKNSFEGATSGVGAGFTWDGNHNVGAGKMTIVESRPPTVVRIKLDFYKPFPGTSWAEFNLVPQGSQTMVSWKMDGKSSFIP